MNNNDIYLYGMILLSTIHRLKGQYPQSDGYQEIEETYILPGGEIANTAVILSKFNYKIRLEGPFLGIKTKLHLLDFFKKYNIDCSGLFYDEDFEGIQDLVLVDDKSRTVFGVFNKFLFDGTKKWTIPDKDAIKSAKIVSIDPFFGKESVLAAEYCISFNKKYITIDCNPDNLIHKNSASTIISNEFIQREFSEEKIENLFYEYVNNSNGLVIFTFGSGEILYGRKKGKINKFSPFKIKVESTLGAGDAFRAGIVHGILNEWTDNEIVKFAASTAALACMRFPVVLNPPDLNDICNLKL